MGGVDTSYNRRNAATIAKSYASVQFNGNWDNLQPGSIVVKNSVAGGATTSSNHVVIYIGKVQMEGDSAPRDYCVECTTTTDKKTGKTISGVQLTSESRMNYIARNYQYAVDPFI